VFISYTSLDMGH